MERHCKHCNQTKPITDFHKNQSGKHGVSQKCKVCTLKYSKKYFKEKHSSIFAKKYNTSEEVVDLILSRTVCDICGCLPKPNKRHSIDHCHITGKIRGLLCDVCNLTLGKFNDNPTLFRKAAEYLDASK